MARPKGSPKLGGRQKGTPNRINADIKGMILEALHNKGGAAYLQRQAEENPVAFMGLVGKVLPMTIAGDKDSPIKTTIEVTWAGMSVSSE